MRGATATARAATILPSRAFHCHARREARGGACSRPGGLLPSSGAARRSVGRPQGSSPSVAVRGARAIVAAVRRAGAASASYCGARICVNSVGPASPVISGLPCSFLVSNGALGPRWSSRRRGAIAPVAARATTIASLRISRAARAVALASTGGWREGARRVLSSRDRVWDGGAVERRDGSAIAAERRRRGTSGAPARKNFSARWKIVLAKYFRTGRIIQNWDP